VLKLKQSWRLTFGAGDGEVGLEKSLRKPGLVISDQHHALMTYTRPLSDSKAKQILQPGAIIILPSTTFIRAYIGILEG
jgi:hypothetical protein